MLTLGACKGVGSRLLPVGLENVCTEVDPISALSTAAVAEKIRSFTVAFSKQDVLLGGKCYSSFFSPHFQHKVIGPFPTRSHWLEPSCKGLSISSSVPVSSLQVICEPHSLLHLPLTE